MLRFANSVFWVAVISLCSFRGSTFENDTQVHVSQQEADTPTACSSNEMDRIAMPPGNAIDDKTTRESTGIGTIMRTYPKGRYALVVDGVVISHPRNVKIKRNGETGQSELEMEIPMEMSGAMYEWIRSAFDVTHVKKSGEIHALDFDMLSQSTRQFVNAQIIEVSMPELDASNKDNLYITVKMRPEKIVYSPGTGSVIEGDIAPEEKTWFSSNFRVEIGDLPCDMVTKIDSFAIEFGIPDDNGDDDDNDDRKRSFHPKKYDKPNLKISFRDADPESWERWRDAFRAQSEDDASRVDTGAITFLDPEMNEELGRMELESVGIVSLEFEDDEANRESISRFNVAMYVRYVSFIILERNEEPVR